MRECFMAGHGPCGGGMTLEHFFSRGLQEYCQGDQAVSKVGGLPWKEPMTLHEIAAGALQARILCRDHNNGLSECDSAALDLMKALDAIDKSRASAPPLVHVDGLLFERWIVKVLCGLVAGWRMGGGVVPEAWKELLRGNPWPTNWGAYFVLDRGPEIAVRTYEITTLVAPDQSILGARVYFGGLWVNLLLGTPDHPHAWGMHRPRGLIFDPETDERRIELKWPVMTEQAVVYTSVGRTTSSPTWFKDYKEPGGETATGTPSA